MGGFFVFRAILVKMEFCYVDFVVQVMSQEEETAVEKEEAPEEVKISYLQKASPFLPGPENFLRSNFCTTKTYFLENFHLRES